MRNQFQLNIEVIDDLLLRYGWSRTVLAQKMGVTKGAVSQILRPGKNVRNTTVQNMATALDVEFRDIIDNEI